MTLPRENMLNTLQRNEVVRHLAMIKPLLAQTPQANAEVEATVLVLITKMMMTLPGARSNEEAAEATGDAYMAVLDELPVWAIDAAIQSWYKGSCEKVGRADHDFRFRPAPAIIRALAFRERWKIASHISDLQQLLDAKERIEYTDKQRSENLNKLAAILKDASDNSIMANLRGHIWPSVPTIPSFSGVEISPILSKQIRGGE